MRLMRYGAVVLVLFACGLLQAAAVYGAQSGESQLKAVFLLNFAKLTEWPADSRPDNNTFTIAILGTITAGSFVNTLQSQTVHGARVSVRRIHEVSEVKGARLVYISESERYRLSGILRELGQQNILTVSDITGFCDAGGMIGLVPVQNRLGFEINLTAAHKAQLSLNSQLLKLARVLYGQ